MAAIASRRQRLLRVMGVTPWTLRAAGAAGAAGAAPVNEVSAANDEAGSERVACVVILPPASERELDVVGKALRAAGAVTGRAARLTVGDSGLEPVPVAATYLVFGEAQARALGHQLPTAVMSAAHIVLVDPPGVIVAEAAAKRRLWNGLRALRRALARS